MSVYLTTWILAFTLQNHHGSDWEHIYTDDGIEVFSQKPVDSDFFGFKGVGTIQASLATVFNVISDVEHELDWVFLLESHRVLETPNAFERIEYQVFDLPWPADHRDFVFSVRAKTIDNKGSVLIEIQSVKVPNPPPSQGVRGELIKSLFLLEPIGPQLTKLTVEIFSDPKGMLPAWVVYFVQKQWPHATIMGIREQVLMPHAKEIPLPPRALTPSGPVTINP